MSGLRWDQAGALPADLAGLSAAQRGSIVLACQLLGRVNDELLGGAYLVVDANGFLAVTTDAVSGRTEKFLRSCDWGSQS